MRHLKLLLTFCAFTFSIINVQSQIVTPSFKGQLYFTSGNRIKTFNLATKTEKILFENGSEPFVPSTGEIYFLNQAFGKKDVQIKKTLPSLIQFKTVLDMSNENPLYKEQLEAYSSIRNEGISAVLSRLATPKVSPNGKYLAVTIFGYQGQAFNENCVGVFDIATGQLVKKFVGKYYGTWMPDNRLVMAGSHKNESVNGSPYKPITPGIFIADATLENVKRIDPELDDPSPYHPSVSPDGKRIAFILNNHVWVMDINGQNLKQVTEVANDNIETFPTWSPDGKWIATWCYKTFEKSYYTAIAIVPSNPAKPIVLSDKAPVWPKDQKGFRVSGGSMQIDWK